MARRYTINYNTEDFAARVKEITTAANAAKGMKPGVKVVYDSVGKDTWDKSLDCLQPFGLMASFGNASGVVPPFAPGILGAKGFYLRDTPNPVQPYHQSRSDAGDG
jgi:NADPH2:quinone reductase